VKYAFQFSSGGWGDEPLALARMKDEKGDGSSHPSSFILAAEIRCT
jgi:hypothetical protein